VVLQHDRGGYREDLRQNLMASPKEIVVAHSLELAEMEAPDQDFASSTQSVAHVRDRICSSSFVNSRFRQTHYSNQYEVDGRIFRARQGSIQVPNELQEVVTGAFGFDQRPQAVPHFRWKRAGERGTDPRAVSSPSFNPTDLAGIYQFPTGVTGSGETVGIIELGGRL
jgi:hypothetical protein